MCEIKELVFILIRVFNTFTKVEILIKANKQNFIMNYFYNMFIYTSVGLSSIIFWQIFQFSEALCMTNVGIQPKRKCHFLMYINKMSFTNNSKLITSWFCLGSYEFWRQFQHCLFKHLLMLLVSHSKNIFNEVNSYLY